MGRVLSFRFDSIMSESLGSQIKPVQDPIASDPQHAGAILEQRIDEGAGQTVHPTSFVNKHFEFVTVVAVEAVLGAEPNKTSIVLENLRNAGLRKTICGGHAGKPGTSSLNDGDIHHGCADAG